MKKLTSLATGCLLFTFATPAFAHAFLSRAVPAVGSTVQATPPELSITFTEGVEPAFSTIELRDSGNKPVPLPKPRLAPGDQRRLIVDIPKLSPGTYEVIWHATSVDTHKTEGNYRFTIAP